MGWWTQVTTSPASVEILARVHKRRNDRDALHFHPLVSGRTLKGTKSVTARTCKRGYLYTRVLYLERLPVFYEMPFKLGNLNRHACQPLL